MSGRRWSGREDPFPNPGPAVREGGRGREGEREGGGGRKGETYIV